MEKVKFLKFLNHFHVLYILKLFQRHWLFGDKIQNDITNGQSKSDCTGPNVQRCRGWFPRKCAIELVEPDSNEHQSHFKLKKKSE